MKLNRLVILASILLFFLAIALATIIGSPQRQPLAASDSTTMLSDPFLQLPTENSVTVVWFTEFPGSNHRVVYGKNFAFSATANTTKLSHAREDIKSRTVKKYQQTSDREIWRHEATVSGLREYKPVPYRVISSDDRGVEIASRNFTLAPAPPPGKPLKILLTSDHQLKPMTAANLQKVAETIDRVDAVFMAGDLVNVSDRISEWFDDTRFGAFFPVLQGRAKYELDKNGVKTVYRGGEIIQHAPLFTAIGNHEVMGRFSLNKSLSEQFNDPVPRSVAEELYQKIASTVNPTGDPQLKQAWLKTNSFNTDTYEEIFTLPESISGGEKYYAVTFGDIRLVVLYVTNIWRTFSSDPDLTGRYQEAQQNLNQPQNWGYGQFIFESIAKNSPQYNWLEKELASDEFKRAKYKIVMFHHPPHSLGDNVVPPYSDPIQKITYAEDGTRSAIAYDYPKQEDYIIKNILPLLESAGVQLVYYGHSHLWNRFVSRGGMHFLESSNVGNTYGAYLGLRTRTIPKDKDEFNYVATGDPNGLEAIVPNLEPIRDEDGNPLPYIASNDITVFSILDTSDGTISSYRFNTRQPDTDVILFDRFNL